MVNYRILNRIVEINIANIKYTDIELSGNTCFVGTNNFGKTSLQRAILFFYSANTRGLGIASSQKPFEEHYFRYENSYLIYEVATEEKNFFVIAYRHNKVCFRFVDAAYNSDFFFNENDEAMKIGEVLKGLEKAGIYVSNQIDTYERYRNVIYGTETDKGLSKFFILKGNEKYQNIPKSITNVFLSSKSSVDSRFIKDFIANAITSETSGIKLEQVERQLRQFHEKYTDIETYLKKETLMLIEMIEKKFDQVKMIKGSQYELAEKLGNSLRYAETQTDGIVAAKVAKEEELQQHSADFDLLKANNEDQQNNIREEIGYYDRTIRDANKKMKEYQNQHIDVAVEKFNDREKLQVDLNLSRKEYETLTANVQSLELKYSSLLEQVQNERNSFMNMSNAKISQLFNDYNERQLLLKNDNSRKENELKERRDKVVAEINSEITSKQIEFNELKSEEKVIRSSRFYEKEIKELEAELNELRAITYKNRSEKAIKNNLVLTLQKDWEGSELKLKSQLTGKIEKVNEEINAKREEIKKIEAKLNVQADAFYGYLEKNFKNWHETIGKVCNEDILFRSDLKPEIKQGLTDSLYGISLELGSVSSASKSIEEYQSEKNILLAAIKEIEEGLGQYQAANSEEKMLIADRFGKQIGELKEDVKVLIYSLELAEKRETKLVAELEEWNTKANSEVESTLTGNRQKQNLLEEELSILSKRKN
ncbi:MAG: ATP-binding protein, partial [Bacteroidia bacterium]